MILNKKMTPEEFFSTEHVHLLGHAPLAEFYLPTEMVITQPKLCVPRTARMYRTELYVASDNSIVGYDKLREKEADFYGTSYYPHIYLWEVWEEYGSDGHINFTLEGYVFLRSDIKMFDNNTYPSDIIRDLIEEQIKEKK